MQEKTISEEMSEKSFRKLIKLAIYASAAGNDIYWPYIAVICGYPKQGEDYKKIFLPEIIKIRNGEILSYL